MIFKNIDFVENKSEKSALLEKMLLYIRICESISQIHSIEYTKISSEISDQTIKKISDIGLIESSSKLELLQRKSGTLFSSFVKAVNFSILYKKQIGNHLDKLNNKIRETYQKAELRKNKPTVADFFCGAGGLSVGFVREGFRIAFANDYEDVCIDTYSYNHPEVPNERIINGDIRLIVDNIENYVKEDVDVVVGGPPCQGFSSANQQRIIDDPRNELYKYFLKAVERLAPKFVVMENVRGMLPYANQIVEDFENILTSEGNYYEVGFRLFVSDDFGVAQKRQRLIFIAVRNDVSEIQEITSEQLLQEIQNNNKVNESFNLSEALDFIEPLHANRIKNTNEVDSEISGKKVSVNKYKGNENEYLSLINENRKIPILYNHKARYVSDVNYEIYSTLEQGDDATNEKIQHIMPYAHRNHVFKDKYFKLVADKPSRTITAHLRMDCHSHIHPFQVRSITPREAARIQSFPDDYVFLGAYLKTYMQIGNAVPPLMAKGIAEVINKYI